jgi:hypothetical protein
LTEEEKLSKEELQNLQDAEEMLKKDSKYIFIAVGNKNCPQIPFTKKN